MGELKKMFNPETIVFIGADDREGSLERTIIDNLLLSSEGRKIYAVNNEKDRVLNLNCHPTVYDIDDHIDLAVIVAPDELILDRIEECARKGVEGAVVVSAGPRRSREEREKFEKEIWEIRKQYGMRIIGPDSTGIILPNKGIRATLLRVDPAPGSIAFISQNGTIGSTILHRGVANNIGFSMFISLGSMVDVDFADVIDFLQEDYLTKSIMLYVEHIKNAKRFLSASRCFARNKPVVVLKPGRYFQSAELLNVYAGRKIGRDDVYNAAFRRVGIVRVREMCDLFNTAEILVSKSIPRGSRIAVITNSGGIGIIICDTLAEQRGQLAELSEKGLENLRSIISGTCSLRNPIDISVYADLERYIRSMDVCIKDEGVDGIIVVYTPTSHCDPIELAREVGELSKGTAKPIIAVWMGYIYSDEVTGHFKAAAVPVYEMPEDAVRAYMYMHNYHQGIELLNETPEEVSQNTMYLINHLRALVRNAIKEGREVFSGEDAISFFRNYNIPFIKGPTHKDLTAMQENLIDEWALRCIRDIDFGAVIFLVSMRRAMRQRTGFAVGLPPLNSVLAKRLLEEAGFPEESQFVVRQMEEILINFSNFIVDFPEFKEIEIQIIITADKKIYSGNAVIKLDTGYQESIVQYPHLVIMPYPARYVMPWKLRDGRDIILRPLKAEDEPLIKEMMSTLSEDTLRVRFFVIMEINHRMLMQFCNIDYDREIAIVAELKEGDKKRIIGGVRLIVEPDLKSGQFALLVSDEFQRQGLGEKFLDTIIGIAQEKGLREIYGIVLTENIKMIELTKKMGFKSTKMPDGITRVSMELF